MRRAAFRIVRRCNNPPYRNSESPSTTRYQDTPGYRPEYLDIAWSMGIRYFDTADCYLHGQSEKNVAAWLAEHTERRKEIFLVSKDHPHKGPEELLDMIDRRLAACGTTF